MDLLKEHIDRLIAERNNLRAQLKRVEAAIAALTGSGDQRQNNVGGVGKNKFSGSRIAPPGGWAKAVEDVFFKDDLDGLKANGVIDHIHGKGFDGAKTKNGLNAIRQALYRMVDPKELLYKTDDGVYHKTDKHIEISPSGKTKESNHGNGEYVERVAAE